MAFHNGGQHAYMTNMSVISYNIRFDHNVYGLSTAQTVLNTQSMTALHVRIHSKTANRQISDVWSTYYAFPSRVLSMQSHDAAQAASSFRSSSSLTLDLGTVVAVCECVWRG